MTGDDSTSRRFRGAGVPTLLTAVFVAGVAAGFMLYGRQLWTLFRHPEQLRELIASWGAWAPLVIIAFEVLQIVVAPLPGHVVAFAVGYAFGFWPGIAWLMLGILLGSSLSFMLARLLGRRILRHLVPPARLARLDSAVVRRGTLYIFLLILVPNPVGDLAYYLAGLTRLPFPLFLAMVLAARLPSSAIESGLGSGATRFGTVQWLVLAGAALVLTGLYLANQKRIGRLLEKWSHVGRFAGPGRTGDPADH
ncbi:MAG: VTT domain-containing protein [bacterium]